jgi:ribonuclease H / adenosylcobalamin/alpha-ribazole phosphatase
VADEQPGRAPRPPGFRGDATTFVLARHGRTEHTEARLLSGGGSDPGLSGTGLLDARRLAGAVAALGGPGATVPGIGPVTRVQVSPQLRARQTLEQVLAELSLDVEPEVRPGWQEISFGDWEGMALADLYARHPDQVARWFDASDVAPPGGESVLGLRDRVVGQVRETAAAHPGEVVLVVTHGGPIAAVVNHALDSGPRALWRVMVEPCSITVVRFWPDGGVQVTAVNAASHLVDERSASAAEW